MHWVSPRRFGLGPKRGANPQMGNQMRNLVLSYLNDETGAAAAEYALILAIIGTAIGAAVYALGTDITTAIKNADKCVKTPSAC
jgi:pilus assembly protein Flp/PilA